MTKYAVGLTERAEVDTDQIFLRYNRQSFASAERWLAGLTAALASLSVFLNRCSLAHDSHTYPDVTVRRLLYGKYRILFHVIEAQEQELDTKGDVRVLRILHGASISAASEDN